MRFDEQDGVVVAESGGLGWAGAGARLEGAQTSLHPSPAGGLVCSWDGPTC